MNLRTVVFGFWDRYGWEDYQSLGCQGATALVIGNEGKDFTSVEEKG